LADVLKVAHHGSKYSTSDEILENVNPKIAVIEVGKNSYGHPTPEVLQKLEKFGIRVLRTDTSGDIKIASDGSNIYLKN
jgi:competence protein ComEC